MKPANLLVIMSDEHSRKVLGCYGHPIVKTPNLDALARRGTRFTAAYTPSPICVPARAAFATGRHAHEIACWDNAFAYDGTTPRWHHALRGQGHEVVAIGKLHFRSPRDDNGFSREIIPMHIVDEVGDVLGLLRDRVFERKGAAKLAGLAGPGESSYTAYDRSITEAAVDWIRAAAERRHDKPWVLFVSLVTPHFPLTAPQKFYDMYAGRPLPLPKQYATADRPQHPYLKDYAESFTYDSYFDADSLQRALAGYFGLCSFVDDNVGQILGALDATGAANSTRIVYLSDHGDNLGARGLWGKSTMYEEAVGIPLIAAGPGLPEGSVERRPASLLDVVPFIFEATGASGEMLGDLPGRAILTDRFSDAPVVAQYHATGSKSAAYMVRLGDFKYVHYSAEDYPDQLFDLASDPEEIKDLAGDPAHEAALQRCRRALLDVLDPAAVDREARAAQARRVLELGGPDAILKRGDFGFSPPPGVTPVFS
ncbi:MAG: sulfatase-like hydrolase/transferase [Proteobacteria bacterium]|nr:sulfatase-like hydrolase/transferase [Pseudomonadota bacterium]